MSKTDYGQIIKSAWKLAFKKPCFWAMGALIGLELADLSIFMDSEAGLDSVLAGIRRFWLFSYENWPALLALAIFLGAITLMFSILRHIARCGIMKSVFDRKADSGIHTGSCWRSGLRYFPKTWIISALALICLLSSALFLSLPVAVLLARGSESSGTWLALVATLIFMALALTIIFTARFASLYSVSSGLSIRSSIERGYQLLKNNVSRSLTMGLILAGFGMTYALLISAIMSGAASLAGPFLIGYFSLDDISIHALSLWAAISLVTGTMRAILLAPLLSFAEISWALLFMDLTASRDGVFSAAPANPVSKRGDESLLSPVKTDAVAERVDNSRLN